MLNVSTNETFLLAEILSANEISGPGAYTTSGELHVHVDALLHGTMYYINAIMTATLASTLMIHVHVFNATGRPVLLHAACNITNM